MATPNLRDDTIVDNEGTFRFNELPTEIRRRIINFWIPHFMADNDERRSKEWKGTRFALTVYSKPFERADTTSTVVEGETKSPRRLDIVFCTLLNFAKILISKEFVFQTLFWYLQKQNSRVTICELCFSDAPSNPPNRPLRFFLAQEMRPVLLRMQEVCIQNAVLADTSTRYLQAMLRFMPNLTIINIIDIERNWIEAPTMSEDMENLKLWLAYCDLVIGEEGPIPLYSCDDELETTIVENSLATFLDICGVRILSVLEERPEIECRLCCELVLHQESSRNALYYLYDMYSKIDLSTMELISLHVMLDVNEDDYR